MYHGANIDVNTVMRLTYTCTHAAGIRHLQKQMQMEYGIYKNRCRWNTAFTKTHVSQKRHLQKQGALRFTAFVNYIFTDKSNQRFDLAVNEQLLMIPKNVKIYCDS